MIKKFLSRLTVLSLLVLLAHNAWAGTSVDFNDINCESAWLLNINEDPQTDSSGNGITGDVNGATFTASGKYDGGYDFDGSLDDIGYGINTWNGLTAGSYSAVLYAYLDALPGTDDFDRLLDFEGRILYIEAREVDSTWRSGIYNGSTTFETTSTTKYVTGEWIHFAGIVDSAGSKVYLYINGVEEDNIAYTGTPDNSQSRQNNIGLAYDDTGGSVDGRMDEVAVFSDVLTSTEVNDIMDNGLAPVAAAAGQVILISKLDND